MKKFITISLVVGAAMGCMDVNLLDDVILWDADTDSGILEFGSDTDTMAARPPETDASDVTPPLLKTICESSETVLDGACGIDTNASFYIRINTDEPSSVSAFSQTAEVLSENWQMLHEVIVQKEEFVQEVTVSLVDVNQNERSISVLVSEVVNPAVVITEVLADCIGDEPDNEYVEIANVGTADVDLMGWMIDDNNDQNGDVFDMSAVLPAGEVATVAMNGFLGAPGMLVPLDSSLGSSGLKNSASESIQLYDANGVLMDAFSTQQIPEEGKPFVRRHVLLPGAAREPWVLR